MRSASPRLRAVAAIAATVVGAAAYAGSSPPARIVHVTAQKFEFAPSEIDLMKGEPVRLEIASLDRLHGFDVPELGIRMDVPAGQRAELDLVPQRTGTFEFHCDNFCGSAHEDMTGMIVVTD